MVAETKTKKPTCPFAAAACLILLLVEAVKLAAFCAAAPAVRASDAGGYWMLGDQVAHADIWMARNPVAYRTPGYPWMIGLLKALCGRHGWFVVVALQYCAVWLTSALTAWWTMRVTGRPWLAVLSLGICVISAARPSHASTIMTETFFTLFFTATLVSISLLGEKISLRRSFLIGVLWGFTWLLRPVAATLAPAWFVAFWLLHPTKFNFSSRERFLSAIVTVGVLLVMLGPWMVRNKLLFQRPSLTVFLGRELWLTTFGPGQPTPPSLPDTEASRRLQEFVLKGGDVPAWNNQWTVTTRLTDAGLSDVEADELMKSVSQEAISRNPFRTLARFIWRSIDFWRSVYSCSMTFFEGLSEFDQLADHGDLSWQSQRCQSFRDAWLKNAWEGRLLGIELMSTLALVGLGGLWLSPRTWRLAAVLTAAILGTSLLTAVVEYPSYRYRMILEPVMIVCTMVGWDVIVEVIRRGRRSIIQEASSTKAS